jgi:NAD kinase
VKIPRVVIVTRPTDYEALLARHGTKEQARFFLRTRGRNLDEVEAANKQFQDALQRVTQFVPVSWRRIRIPRSDLPQFRFDKDDLVVTVGPDGLVANVAKYASKQQVIGFNPDPASYEGLLAKHAPEKAGLVLMAAAEGKARVEERTMVEAVTDDGQKLLALNEVYVGHSSHQSARYTLKLGSQKERQSSSGVIVTTGTGGSGWASSLHRQVRSNWPLPQPDQPVLAYFVREPFPGVSLGTMLTSGLLGENESVEIISEMNEGGTLFGDGLEQDRIQLPWGVSVTVRVAQQKLKLVVPDRK